jgi:hypothetical protein
MNQMNGNNGAGALGHFILESQATADNTLNNNRPPINLTNPHKNRLLLNKSKSTGTSSVIQPFSSQ